MSAHLSISRGRRNRAMRRWGAGAFLVAVLLFLFLPMALIVAFSFNASPRLSFPITGITGHWYRTALGDPQFVQALQNSLLLACCTAVAAVALGTTAAFGVQRFRPRAQATIAYAALLPSIVPALVLAIALAVTHNAAGVVLSLKTALIGHVLIAFPFVFLTLRARLDAFDSRAVEAARDLGASRTRAFRDITLPLIRPAILGAALISISLSLDEFVITSFTIGADETLPVLIWAKMRRGVDPGVNALATLVLAGTLAAGMLSYRLSRIRL
jgi:ABC-type spermidine/putrescine transport system permease subunit II